MRTYINLFLDNSIDLLIARGLDTNDLKILLDTANMQKRSDWDYNIYINPTFTDAKYNKIRNDMIILMTQALSIIQDKMFVDYSIDSKIINMGDILQKNFWNTDMQQTINDYFQSNGLNIKLKDIITTHQKITQNSIESTFDPQFKNFRKLDKMSYVVQRDVADPKKRFFIENENFYKDADLDNPYYLTPSDLSEFYIGYSDDVRIYAQYISHNFSLLRLKINNIFIDNFIIRIN